MAADFSVKAILSARDEGFSSAFRTAVDATDSLGSKIKSGIGFGVFMAIGQKAVNAVTGSISGLIGEMNNSSATWKTFQGNMEMNGKSQKQIKATKKELQSFAEQTIYSSSDMASTFAQLDAVGTKNTIDLVKGFGGLAAASEDPRQAMKTLSQQATQMAAKPTVQWEDFKLMVEQTPAGVAAVAKQMGMSTQDMIKNVQSGKIKTDDFFDAISKVGTNDAFTKLATEYKTVDQAVDGLTETVGNKLQPAFDVVSEVAIKGVSGITDALGSIDGEALATKVSAGLKKAQPYWDSFKSVAIGVGDVLKTVGGFLLDHAGAISKVIPVALGLVGAYKGFSIVKSIVPGVQKISKSILQLAGKGAGKIVGRLFGVASGEKAVGKASKMSSKSITTTAKAMMMLGAGVLMVAIGFSAMALAAVKLADSGGLAVGIFAGMVIAVGVLGGGMAKMLNSVKGGPGKIKTISKAMLTFGISISLIIGALAGLALAIKPLASLGTTAIAPLLTFGVVVGGLGVILANMGTKLQAGAVGIAVFAASVSIMSLAMAPLASAGTEGAIAMGTFGVVVAGLVAVFSIFGSALTTAIPAMLAFGATILMVGTGAAKASLFINALTPFIRQLGNSVMQVAGAISSAVARIVTVVGGVLCSVMLTAGGVITSVINSISAGFKTVSEGVATVVDAISGGFSKVLDSVARVIESIGTSARNAGEGFRFVAEGISMISGLSLAAIAKSLGAVALGLGKISSKGSGLTKASSGLKGISSAVRSAGSGFETLGSKASSAMIRVRTVINGTANTAKTAGRQAGAGFTQALQAGLNRAPSIASKAVVQIGSKLQSGKEKARKAGVYMSQGFAIGMESYLGRIRSAANKMVAAADQAIIAKAKIGSPSRLTKSHGRFIAIGLGIGIRKGIKSVTSASKSLASAAINTMKTATKTRNYESAASKAINKYKASMNSKVSKVTKSLNKTVDNSIKKLQKKNPKLKKEYSKIGKLLKSNVSKTIKSQGNKAIAATEKTLNALAKKYQEKYDKIASDRANYYDKLSDYGSLYSVDSYGFVALKDFKAQTSQVKSLGKNMEQLKKSLPYDLMKDIQNMDTSSALAYTNELLKKGTPWLKQYGKDYTAFMNTSKTTSNSYYKPYIDKLDKDYNAAVTSTLKKLNKQLNTIGQQATKGLIKGLTSKSSKKALKKAANNLASILTKAIRGKLKIHSPSRVLMSLGSYAGQGFVEGLESMRKAAVKTMDNLVELPQIANPALAGNFGGELSADYEYHRSAQYTIVVPVELDGKETAKIIAPYTEAELNKRQSRENRKHGRR